jgi:hypothetical protein
MSFVWLGLKNTGEKVPHDKKASNNGLGSKALGSLKCLTRKAFSSCKRSQIQNIFHMTTPRQSYAMYAYVCIESLLCVEPSELYSLTFLAAKELVSKDSRLRCTGLTHDYLYSEAEISKVVEF